MCIYIYIYIYIIHSCMHIFVMCLCVVHVLKLWLYGFIGLSLFIDVRAYGMFV